MKTHGTVRSIVADAVRVAHNVGSVAALGSCLLLIGCATGEMTTGPSSEPGHSGQASASFDAALKQHQAALLERKGPTDVALYNIGLILSHPSNPRKDQQKALHSFKAVVTEHPGSKYVDLAKTWIQVLEQQQKNEQERQRLAEEKRALSRERETLAQERQKLNFATERSQQLDVEIEKRRRQSLSK